MQTLKPIYRKFDISHQLEIETVCYTNIERNQRLYTLCDSGDIEDEFHFIPKCSFYTNLRSKYLKHVYIITPSMMKIVELLPPESIKELANLSKFIIFSTKKGQKH